MNEEQAQLKVLKIMAHHHGRANAIGMGELYQAVYGEPWAHRINDTRKLRKVILALQEEGIPICSTSDSTGGGYYLASVGTDLEDYLQRKHVRALKILALEARLRRVTLPELLGQMSLNAGMGTHAAADGETSGG